MSSTRYNELAECTAEDVQEEYACDCPAVDIREENDRYILEANLPGLTEKDVEVRVEDNYLTLSSRKTNEKTEGGIKYLMRERGESFFERSFILPKDSDRDKIEAHFKNGVLTLSIGRAEALKPRLIDVKID
jgi:HSP20 family protein